MKLLVFTDMHASLSAFKKLQKKIKKKKPDIIVCAGDVSMFENGLNYILKAFNKFKIPMLIIHGNHETKSSMKKVCRKLKYIHFIHGIHSKFDNAVFLGFGGGGFNKYEPELKKLSKKFKRIIDSNEDKKIILVTHAPPFKTKLDKIGKSHCGTKTIRWFVKHNRVDYLICGHIHENEGKNDVIKDTILMNPGPYGRIIKM